MAPLMGCVWPDMPTLCGLAQPAVASFTEPVQASRSSVGCRPAVLAMVGVQRRQARHQCIGKIVAHAVDDLEMRFS